MGVAQLRDGIQGVMEQSYWDTYYSYSTFEDPSPFCKYVISKYLQATDSVVEIGCGEGRDGLEISKHVQSYIGIDKSQTAILAANKKLKISYNDESRNIFKVGSFQDMDLNLFSTSADRLVVYSRFSLHADDENAENKLISSFQHYDETPLLVLIEVRTIYDELYGLGQLIEKNAFVSDHYRRFVDPKEFLGKIDNDFYLHEFSVSRGFAKFETEDPMVLRIAFSKR